MLAKIQRPLTSIGLETNLLLAKQAHQIELQTTDWYIVSSKPCPA